MPLAYFTTLIQLILLFWEAAAILELECILRVIAARPDGSYSNRRFSQLHNAKINNLNRLSYKTFNFFAESREIYFFSGPPIY